MRIRASVLASLAGLLLIAPACSSSSTPPPESPVAEAPPPPSPPQPAEPPPPPSPPATLVKLANSRGGVTELDTADKVKLDDLQGYGITPPPSVQIVSPKDGATIKGNSIEVKLALQNYDIQNQDPNKAYQHAHILLDNGPYEAHYDPNGATVLKDVAPGTHVITAFLAREFHLSLKNPEAVAQIVVHVKKKSPKGKVPDLKGPMMVYSRPKGTYSKGKGHADALLLDFYLRNVELAADGHHVRATVDGDKQTFDFAEWKPEIIKDLSVGEHTVKLELLDKDGNLVAHPWNPTERKITVEP
ncbi:MAG: hypothetical protein IT384_09700 [Deltaproteobacteria bacterium]|nr:hypothetical protein [Deltaproteobacteria bacterium]